MHLTCANRKKMNERIYTHLKGYKVLASACIHFALWEILNFNIDHFLLMKIKHLGMAELTLP